MKEFKINEYITLKLEESKTYLYLNNEKFKQCMQLVLQIPKNNVNVYDTIDSIDEAAKVYNNEIEREKISNQLKIPPEEEFWGHCSNLQAWYENDYDTRLLHSNLAFPLLHELVKLNDPKAKRVFKDEVIERIKSGQPSIFEFLLRQRYLDYLNAEEIDTLFQDLDLDLILKQKPRILITLYKKFVKLGAFKAKKIILREITERFFDENPLTMGPLFDLGFSQFFDLIEQEKEWFFSQFKPLEMGKNYEEIYKNKFFYNFKHGDYSIVRALIWSNYIRTLNRDEINNLFENINYDDYSIVRALILSNYILTLNCDKINSLFEDFDYGLILREDPTSAPPIFERLIKLKAPNAKKFYRDYVFEKFNSGNNSMITFLVRHGYLWHLDKNNLPILFDKIDYEYIMEQKDAFTLFKILKYLGAPNVEEKYKQSIAKLIRTGLDFYNTAELIIHGLLDEFNIEYLKEIFRGFDYEHIAEQYFDIAPLFLEKLIELGVQEAKEFYESEDFLKKILIDDEIPFFLDLCSRLNPPIHMSRPNIDWTQSSPYRERLTIVNKRIIELNLKGCKLNEIPDNIGKLTQLKKINLLENCLNSLPSSMSNLKILKELELSHNQFDEFPYVISQLNSLEKLKLKRNFIKEVPDTISKLSSLSLLNLRRNNLKILPKSLSSLKNLAILDLSFNNLDSIPENINKLESLEILVYDYNNLKVLPDTIGNLIKLKRLYVDGNPLTSLPESILRINSLEMLSVNPEYLDENSNSILKLLSDKNVIISSPPYTIRFDLYDDEYCFSPKDQNTQKKFSRYINPERLPLTSSIIDKLDELYLTVYALRIDEITPELCTSIFETFEEVKNQLNPNFKVIFDEYFKREILNQRELDQCSS